MVHKNLLIIAGTGTKCGKTTMACRLIEQYRGLKITAIKITPHFHETTPGLKALAEKDGYSIYEETDCEGPKDTSRMLKAGASRVVFAKVHDNRLTDAFNEIMKDVPSDTPVICESTGLRNYVEPGVFIIMTADTINKHKNINNLQDLPHVSFKLEKLGEIESLPVFFEYGKWRILPGL